MRYKAFEAAEILKIPNINLDANAETRLLEGNDSENTVTEVRQYYIGDTENQLVRLHAVYCHYVCVGRKWEDENV